MSLEKKQRSILTSAVGKITREKNEEADNPTLSLSEGRISRMGGQKIKEQKSEITEPEIFASGSASYLPFSTLSTVSFAIGNDNFRTMAEDKGRIIDKSLFIKEFLETKCLINLIVRPRRFGKTFNMTMLASFLDYKIKQQARSLFQAMAIWSVDNGHYQQFQGQYAVIFITFKDIKANNFKMALKQMRELIRRTYVNSIKDHGLVPNVGMQKMLAGEMSEIALQFSLLELIKLLQKTTNKKVILLLDEYDTPLHEAYFNQSSQELDNPSGYYKQMGRFLDVMFYRTLTGNPYLYRAAITGILPAPINNAFSFLNNIKINSIVDDDFSDYFGFTGKEVNQELMNALGPSTGARLFPQVAEWYGGYRIGKNILFNPWSVTNFIEDNRKLLEKSTVTFRNYWLNTSSNELIKNLLKKFLKSIQSDVIKLINNQPITKTIHHAASYELVTNNSDMLWGFLLLSGYLTTCQDNMGDSAESQLVIPNQEIYAFYVSQISHALKLPEKTLKFEQYNFESQKLVIKPSTIASYGLVTPAAIFVGRKDLLEQITKQFAAKTKSREKESKGEQQYKSTPTIVLCSGLGGVGKTQLALRYAHSALNPYHHKYFFIAGSRKDLIHNYRLFAKENRLIDEGCVSDEEVIQAVHRKFSNESSWLIIYDNVENYEELRPFLPEEGEGDILITSRLAPHRWSKKIITISVDVLSPAEAHELVGYLIDQPNDPAISQLAKQMGYLPLALAQACAYIRQSNISVATYLKAYEKHSAFLLNQPDVLEHNPVFITWNISLEAIAKEERSAGKTVQAHEFLLFLAYLNPQKIPDFIVSAWHKEKYPYTREPYQEARGRLQAYSFLQVEKNGDIQMHRLIQQVVQAQLAPSQQAAQLISSMQLLIKIYPAEDSDIGREQDEIRFSLIPHLESVIKYYDQQKQLKEDKKSEEILGEILCLLASAYGDLGQPASQRQLLERALPIFKRQFGENHWKVGVVLGNLANVQGDLGNPLHQRQLLEQALGIIQDHNEKEKNNKIINIFTSILGSLANIYGTLDEPLKQRALLERVVKIFETQYGPKHWQTAIALTNLANAYGQLGEYKAQLDLLQRALLIENMCYGNNHWQTANTQTNLAIAYGSVGEYKKQLTILMSVRPILEQHYGPRHWQVANALINLANAYRALDDREKHYDLLQQALSIQEENYGAKHWRTAITHYNLVYAYLERNELPKARISAIKSLAVCMNHFGIFHKDTRRAVNLLLDTYRNLDILKVKTKAKKLKLKNLLTWETTLSNKALRSVSIFNDFLVINLAHHPLAYRFFLDLACTIESSKKNPIIIFNFPEQITETELTVSLSIEWLKQLCQSDKPVFQKVCRHLGIKENDFIKVVKQNLNPLIYKSSDEYEPAAVFWHQLKQPLLHSNSYGILAKEFRRCRIGARKTNEIFIQPSLTRNLENKLEENKPAQVENPKVKDDGKFVSRCSVQAELGDMPKTPQLDKTMENMKNKKEFKSEIAAPGSIVAVKSLHAPAVIVDPIMPDQEELDQSASASQSSSYEVLDSKLKTIESSVSGVGGKYMNINFFGSSAQKGVEINKLESKGKIVEEVKMVIPHDHSEKKGAMRIGSMTENSLPDVENTFMSNVAESSHIVEGGRVKLTNVWVAPAAKFIQISTKKNFSFNMKEAPAPPKSSPDSDDGSGLLASVLSSSKI